MDAAANNPNLRVVGQKDLVNQQAHLWIQNKAHTGRNVVDGSSISPVSGTVTISGFRGGQNYSILWWDTYSTDSAIQITRTEVVTARPGGDLVLTLRNLVDDTAVRIVE